MKKYSGMLAVLLALAVMLTLMPLTVSAESASESKDLSEYEVVVKGSKDGWRLFTPEKSGITMKVAVKKGKETVSPDKYTLRIQQESFDKNGKASFRTVKNGKLKLDKSGCATFIVYAVAKSGSGYKGHTEKEHYVDIFYKYSVHGCDVKLAKKYKRADISTPMFDLYVAAKGNKPVPKVYVDGKLLKAGRDYTLKYKEAKIVKGGEWTNDEGETISNYFINEKKNGKTYKTVPSKKGYYKMLIQGKGKYSGRFDQAGIQIR